MALKIIARVVPLVGTWIETYNHPFFVRIYVSFPSWERGLKRDIVINAVPTLRCRSPRGNVD